jgi:hypothetical protein
VLGLDREVERVCVGQLLGRHSRCVVAVDIHRHEANDTRSLSPERRSSTCHRCVLL